jgi:hypothetical protein
MRLQRRARDGGVVSAAVVVVFANAPVANRCLAELKRLHTARTWGDVHLRPLGDRAEMEVPATVWPDVRGTVTQFGGRRI